MGEFSPEINSIRRIRSQQHNHDNWSKTAATAAEEIASRRLCRARSSKRVVTSVPRAPKHSLYSLFVGCCAVTLATVIFKAQPTTQRPIYKRSADSLTGAMVSFINPVCSLCFSLILLVQCKANHTIYNLIQNRNHTLSPWNLREAHAQQK